MSVFRLPLIVDIQSFPLFSGPPLHFFPSVTRQPLSALFNFYSPALRIYEVIGDLFFESFFLPGSPFFFFFLPPTYPSLRRMGNPSRHRTRSWTAGASKAANLGSAAPRPFQDRFFSTLSPLFSCGVGRPPLNSQRPLPPSVNRTPIVTFFPQLFFFSDFFPLLQ